jgi:hypothetical protein
MIVHAEPNTTCRNSSGQSLFAAIAAISAANTTATIGSPFSGTISKSVRAGAAAGAGTATSVTCGSYAIRRR